MPSFSTIVYSLLAFLSLLQPSITTAALYELATVDNTRIVGLLPNLLCHLAVNPGIPQNFIALAPNGKPDVYDWIYWGPKDVLKKYFSDNKSLKEPILRVKLSPNVAQIGMREFDQNFTQFLAAMKKNQCDTFSFTEMQWGDYPVVAMQLKEDNSFIHTALVGLNDRSGGWTLIFELIYAEGKNKPDEKDLQFWKDFLTKTVPLSDWEYFKCMGQDLQIGYTDLRVGPTQFRIYAEKRKRDGMMQVVVVPAKSSMGFEYIDMFECLMGAKWRYGEPMVKIEANLNEKKSYFDGHTTSVFFKIVPEFSVNKEESNNPLIFQKVCEMEM